MRRQQAGCWGEGWGGAGGGGKKKRSWKGQTQDGGEGRGEQEEVAPPTPGGAHQELGAPTDCLDVLQHPGVHEDLMPSWYLAGSQFSLAQKLRIILTIFS